MTQDPQPDGWLDAARRIVAAVRGSDVAELEVRHGGFRLRVRREVAASGLPAVLPGAAGLAAQAGAAATAEAAAASARRHRVTAPLTGVFYRAASPTAKPYVSEGDWVDAEAVVGLIETMKIFNEVTADRPGRVVAFLAQPGQLVQAGDPLLELEPGERTAAEPERSL